MTKEELEGVKTLLPFLAIKHIDPQPFADVIAALERAWCTIVCHEQDILTLSRKAVSEAMTKNELEQIQLNVLSFAALSPASTIEKLSSALTQAWGKRDDAIKARDFLSGQNTELLEDIASVREERDALLSENKLLKDECDALKARVERLGEKP